MASQSSESSFEPIDSKSIEEAIEDEDLSFVMAEDNASDKISDEMSRSKYSQVIKNHFNENVTKIFSVKDEPLDCITLNVSGLLIKMYFEILIGGIPSNR